MGYSGTANAIDQSNWKINSKLTKPLSLDGLFSPKDLI